MEDFVRRYLQMVQPAPLLIDLLHELRERGCARTGHRRYGQQSAHLGRAPAVFLELTAKLAFEPAAMRGQRTPQEADMPLRRRREQSRHREGSVGSASAYILDF